MKISCPSEEQLSWLLADTLPEPLRSGVGHHVDGCAECQLILEQLTSEPPPVDTVSSVRNTAVTDDHPVLAQLIAKLRTMAPGERGKLGPEGTGTVDQRVVDQRAPLALADFELQQCLGRGGMGTVFRAVQRSLKKPVAIKVLDPVDAASEELARRFLTEACAAASLRHANIVDVHGVGRTLEGGYFLVMDLVEGGDLEQFAGTGLPAESDPAELVATLAEAVHHAHGEGIIHRDLKPANVLLSRAGIPLVSDFGIAKLVTVGNSSSTDEQLLGTPAYMAPEQADAARGAIGPATDVYALGGILYFLLTGQPPYPRGDQGQLAILTRVLSEDPPAPPRQLRPDVPAALEQICMRCLAKRPEERFASARELAVALRSIPSAEAMSQPGRKTWHLEPPLGAIALESSYYLPRDADAVYRAALARRDSIVLVRGARQMGKTSLMARGLQQARESGARVVLTDLQKLNSRDLESAETLFLALGEWLAEELVLPHTPADVWNPRRGASVNFERFVRREVLGRLDQPLIWGLDEVDRLFPCSFSSEVFGLFRAWHNERALDPSGPWSRLTLAMAYATEAHLFITDLNQSPFNVGTRISLSDFSPEQVAELNRRYQAPLKNRQEIDRFMEWFGGQPYLVNRGLYEMTQRRWSLERLFADSAADDGMFGDHLRRMVLLLAQDTELHTALGRTIRGSGGLTAEQFYRLRSAGILLGETPTQFRWRCGLYQRTLERCL